MSKKVVFFFPSFASTEATAPLGILAIATPLLRAGYSVTVIDSTITPNFKKRVLEEVQDALCLGISLVTGPMIRETVEIARAVKTWNPDFPIILGGWHPSLLPKQTLEAPYIDIVVRGQGEDSLLEVVQHLENRVPMDLIPGIGFKREGKLFFMMDVCRRFPGAEFWTNIFTPYPGSPIMEHAQQLGSQVPSSLEGWADFFPRYTVLPWLNGREHKRLQTMREYLRMAFNRVPIAADTRTRGTRLAQKALSLPARWRMDHDVYGAPVEIWINERLKRRTPGFKPAVDAKRLEPAPEAAAC
jgi:radical SAM superfamily enzyme YgiQ (UPF0313 family)